MTVAAGVVLMGLVAAAAVAVALFVAVVWGRPDRAHRLMRAAFVALAVSVGFVAVYLYIV